jgi:hypothetical protein
MNEETVAFNFPKRRCLVRLDDAEPSTNVKIDRVGITMKLAFLSMKLPGCRIFVDHRGLIFRTGDIVLSCVSLLPSRTRRADDSENDT